MVKNIYKKFFFLIFFLILSILILITFNSNFRKLTLHSVLNIYKAYMTVSMQLYIKHPDPDYVFAPDDTAVVMGRAADILHFQQAFVI